MKTDIAERSHSSVYLTVLKELCGQRSFFQKENIHTNFYFFFHSCLCSFNCATLNLSTLCMLMSHNSQQEPGPVASDWAVLRTCRGNNVCQETSRQAILRWFSLAFIVVVSYSCGERWSHLCSAPSNSIPVMFIMLWSCTGRPRFDQNCNDMIPVEQCPCSWALPTRGSLSTLTSPGVCLSGTRMLF